MRILAPSVALVLCALMFCGCRKDSDDSVVVDNPMVWQWRGEDFFLEDDNLVFFWNSGLNGVVRVELKGDEFEGTIRIRIADGSDILVYDEEITIVGESDFREVEFTNPALAGSWRIRIELEDVSGDLRVIVDDVGL